METFKNWISKNENRKTHEYGHFGSIKNIVHWGMKERGD